MKGVWILAGILYLLCISTVYVAASNAPVSFYDPVTRQNRPVWWIQQNAPSLFYSVDRIEEISQSPWFVLANADKMEHLQSVIERERGAQSLASMRRSQGLTLIEEGENAEEGSITGRGVVGTANNRFAWDQRHGVSDKYRKPLGLVGFLSTAFTQPKNEFYRVRSTYYLNEEQKVNPEVYEVQE